MSDHVIIFEKQLSEATSIPQIRGVTLRSFQDGDIDDWLHLHYQCFGSSDSERRWNQADFRREFLNKEWWSPRRCWFALSENSPVGTVAVGNRPNRNDCGSLLWLMITPDHRRRGIGGMLTCLAEQVSFEIGYRTISLETLSSWSSAVSLYRSLGYHVAIRDHLL